jgi:hypothetical protein
MRMFFCRLLLLHVITRTSNGGPTPTSREENDMKLLNIIRRKYADSQTNDLNPIPMIASSIGGGCGMIASASIGKYTINDGQQISVPSKPNSNYTLNYASITKTLWAMVLQIAIKEGKNFHWNDKISKFIPVASSTDFKDASVLSIASHTACMHTHWMPSAPQSKSFNSKYPNDPLGSSHAWYHAYIDEELLNGKRSDCIISPNDPPDHLYVHDGGAIILMYITTLLYQLNYEDVLRNKIFTPLEMHSAYIRAGPSGGLDASIQDMTRYGRFILSGYRGELELASKHPFSKEALNLLRQEDFISLFTPLTGQVKHPFGKVWITHQIWNQNKISSNGCRGATIHVDADTIRTYVLSDYPSNLNYTFQPNTVNGDCWKWDPWNDIIKNVQQEATFSNKCNELYTTCASNQYRKCKENLSGLCDEPSNYVSTLEYKDNNDNTRNCNDDLYWLSENIDRPLYDFIKYKSCYNLTKDGTNYINYLINKGCCGTNKKSLCDRIEERGASKSPSSNNRENLKDGSTASVILLAILALIGSIVIINILGCFVKMIFFRNNTNTNQSNDSIRLSNIDGIEISPNPLHKKEIRMQMAVRKQNKVRKAKASDNIAIAIVKF